MYGTVEAADQYHADRGNAAWAAATESARTQALVRGSAYVDLLTPVDRLPGVPTDAVQVEYWPRTGARDVWGNEIANDSVPLRVEQAAYEAALAELAAPGSLAPSYTAQERIVKEKIGPLEVQYAEPVDGVAGAVPVLSSVWALLAPLLLSERPYPRVFVA